MLIAKQGNTGERHQKTTRLDTSGYKTGQMRQKDKTKTKTKTEKACVETHN